MSTRSQLTPSPPGLRAPVLEGCLPRSPHSCCRRNAEPSDPQGGPLGLLAADNPALLAVGVPVPPSVPPGAIWAAFLLPSQR